MPSHVGMRLELLAAVGSVLLLLLETAHKPYGASAANYVHLTPIFLEQTGHAPQPCICWSR